MPAAQSSKWRSYCLRASRLQALTLGNTQNARSSECQQVAPTFREPSDIVFFEVVVAFGAHATVSFQSVFVEGVSPIDYNRP